MGWLPFCRHKGLQCRHFGGSYDGAAFLLGRGTFPTFQDIKWTNAAALGHKMLVMFCGRFGRCKCCNLRWRRNAFLRQHLVWELGDIYFCLVSWDCGATDSDTIGGVVLAHKG